MKPNVRTPGARGLFALRDFVLENRELEHCNLCSAPLTERHEHLVDPQSHRLVCACNACAILFANSGATKYRRVLRDIRNLNELTLSDQAWRGLGIPIGLAFVYRSSSPELTIAVYPSPAGPTEANLDPEDWEEIVAENPVLSRILPDVEALLINRMNGRREYFWVPIDECYKLTGIVRRFWRGFSGGEEGWNRITQFFSDLKERASESREAHARSLI